MGFRYVTTTEGSQPSVSISGEHDDGKCLGEWGRHITRDTNSNS